MTNKTALAALILAMSAVAIAQPATPEQRKTPTKTVVDPVAKERLQTAVVLVSSLADEAKSFRDEKLRARIQARAADALWETDQERARSFFHRAWDDAVVADRNSAEKSRLDRQNAERSGGVVTEAPSNVRGEVLRLAAKRDRQMGEEFLAQIAESRRDDSNPTSSQPEPQPAERVNPTDPPAAIRQRFQLASRLLSENEVELALKIADPGLSYVTTDAVTFLSRLRARDATAADTRFAALLRVAVGSPYSDAVAVSVLSSYVFTPFLTIVVTRNGHMTSQMDRPMPPPDIAAELRLAFFQTAFQILMRPLPPKDQDQSLAGREGTYFTIARLLPLFEQYAQNLAPALRTQLSALSPDAPERFRSGNDRMLTQGLDRSETSRPDTQDALDRAARASTPDERDNLYAEAARQASERGDIRARDYADKIDNSDTRKQVRSYIDFNLVDQALSKKDAEGALQLIRTGELSSYQKAWALTTIVGLLKTTDRQRAGEILSDAAAEAQRIDSSEPNRVRALVSVATLMYEIDRGRVWEALGDVVKAANATPGFTGEDARVSSMVRTKNSASIRTSSADNFDVAGIFASVAKDNLYRAIETAKSFTGEAPRSASILAIVRAVLTEKPPAK